jgi:hypothetical protein
VKKEKEYTPKRTRWFALFPVKTNNGWKWLKTVYKLEDDRPERYLGLLPTVWYEEI